MDVLNLARASVRVVRNAANRVFARADYRRWQSPGGLEEWWDERTRMLATLVPPSSSVVEFGAGRRQLEKYLPAGCSYLPSDLTDRGPGTVVCDLNKRPLPDLRSHAVNVAVFSGVLEYVKDVENVVSWLTANGIDTFVLSFDGMPCGLSVLDRVKELRRRTENGYMNNLTETELQAIFLGAGLKCPERRQWTTQGLYRFERSST